MSAAVPRHLDALTGIRGIAAWGVVFFHIRQSLTALLPPEVIWLFAKGYLAVDLFFILSGFVIWHNYAGRIASGRWDETRLFLWRRFARVWPLHFAILAAFTGLALLLTVTGRNASGYPWAELPLHLLLVQNWGLTPNLSWNHPAWSISTEFAAYLLFPALVFAARWERIPSWALIVVAAILALGLHLLFAASGHPRLGDDIPGLGLARCLIGFALGGVMCQLWQRWAALRRAAALIGLACAVIVLAGLGLALPETAWVPAALFAGLLALALDRGPIAQLLGGRALTYLGEISYSTYLAHFGLFIVFKQAFVDESLQLGGSGLAGFLGLVLAASVALYHGLEKPVQRWLNAHPPHWAKRTAPLPAE